MLGQRKGEKDPLGLGSPLVNVKPLSSSNGRGIQVELANNIREFSLTKNLSADCVFLSIGSSDRATFNFDHHLL